MKKWIPVALTLALGLAIASPALARRAVVVQHRGAAHRTTVRVYPGWPVHRATPAVIVRPARVGVVVAPRRYSAPITFRPVTYTWAVVPVSSTVTRPWSWEDAEVLVKGEDWTEFSLHANCRGTAVVAEFEGKVQVEWAEIVFGNGDAQVVDFNQKTQSNGPYRLVDIKDHRVVDHVRMVARAKSDEARVILRVAR